MYRVYLRTLDQQVSQICNTHSQQKALDEFADIVNDRSLDNQPLSVVLSYKKKQLAFHRFDRQPGHVNYWRGRLDEIELPQVGAPKKMEEGKRRNIFIDNASWEKALELGDGIASEGIRIALQRLSKK